MWSKLPYFLKLSDVPLGLYSLINLFFISADPSLTLPALVRLIYTSKERVQSLASETLLVVLKTHKEEPEVLCLLLDCLGYASIFLLQLRFNNFCLFLSFTLKSTVCSESTFSFWDALNESKNQGGAGCCKVNWQNRKPFFFSNLYVYWPIM